MPSRHGIDMHSSSPFQLAPFRIWLSKLPKQTEVKLQAQKRVE